MARSYNGYNADLMASNPNINGQHSDVGNIESGTMVSFYYYTWLVTF